MKNKHYYHWFDKDCMLGYLPEFQSWNFVIGKAVLRVNDMEARALFRTMGKPSLVEVVDNETFETVTEWRPRAA